MNLIVDINPYLIRKYKIDKFILDVNLESEKDKVDINPDGIIASRIYSTFDVENRIFTFLGGMNGKIYENILNSENPNNRIFKVRDETADNVIIEDGRRSFKVFSEIPRITNEEFQEIYYEVLEEIENSDFLMITSGRPVEYRERVYLNILNMAYKSSVKSGISCDEDNIDRIIETKPYLIVLDREALESYSKTEITFNWEVNKIIKGILENGVGKVLFFREDGNLKLFTKDSIYETKSKGFSYSKNKKDRILAGYTAAKARNYDEEMRVSIALAATEVKLDKITMKRDAAEIKNRMKDIEVERFNG